MPVVSVSLSVVSCPHCGCTFPQPSDYLNHCCAAMQQACDDGPGHDWTDAGGGVEICLNCGADRDAPDARHADTFIGEHMPDQGDAR